MRHFLSLAVAVGLLASSMLGGASARSLIATARCSKRRPAGDLGAILYAVNLSPITPRADPNLAVTSLAVVEAVPSLDHAPPPPVGTGQRGDVGSMLRPL